MDTVKIGINLIIRYLGGILMSIVIFLSITAIFTLPLTEAIGYDAYISDEETGRSTKVYTHYYADGEDTKKAEYEAQGLTVYTAQVRSELTGSGAALIFTVAQAMCLVLFFALVPGRVYRLGSDDAAAEKEKSAKNWLFPTLFPTAISLTGFLLLVLNKLRWMGNQGLSLYRYANYHLYGLLRLILGTGNDGTQIGWLSVLLGLAPAAVTVLSCWALYEFGYRDFHPLRLLKNNIKYKRNT